METITNINQLDPEGTYTYADYLHWKLDEYVELFRGKLRRMSPALLREHQRIALRISSRLERFLRRKKCEVNIAPFDVRFPKPGTTANETIYTVVQPDVCIVFDPGKLDEKGCIGAPDTVIEILSGGNLNRDVKEKYAIYEEHGVPEYWIVAPGIKAVTIYRLKATTGKYELSGEYSDEGDKIPVASLPGFSLSWDEIFED